MFSKFVSRFWSQEDISQSEKGQRCSQTTPKRDPSANLPVMAPAALVRARAPPFPAASKSDWKAPAERHPFPTGDPGSDSSEEDADEVSAAAEGKHFSEVFGKYGKSTPELLWGKGKGKCGKGKTVPEGAHFSKKKLLEFDPDFDYPIPEERDVCIKFHPVTSFPCLTVGMSVINVYFLQYSTMVVGKVHAIVLDILLEYLKIRGNRQYGTCEVTWSTKGKTCRTDYLCDGKLFFCVFESHSEFKTFNCVNSETHRLHCAFALIGQAMLPVSALLRTGVVLPSTAFPKQKDRWVPKSNVNVEYMPYPHGPFL